MTVIYAMTFVMSAVLIRKWTLSHQMMMMMMMIMMMLWPQRRVTV